MGERGDSYMALPVVPSKRPVVTVSKKLTFKEKMSYGFGDIGNGLMFDMGQLYLLKFYTDVLGISAYWGGLVFLISKIFFSLIPYIFNFSNNSHLLLKKHFLMILFIT